MRARINPRSKIALYLRDWLQGGPGAAIGVVVAPSSPMLRAINTISLLAPSRHYCANMVRSPSTPDVPALWRRNPYFEGCFNADALFTRY
jgi:hypothetical protein